MSSYIHTPNIAHPPHAAPRTPHPATIKGAIVAALSCGIYGGIHQQQLRAEYAQLCIDALLKVEAEHGPFREVIIPQW